MRRPERTLREEPLPGAEPSRDGPHRGGLDSFLEGGRRQESRDAAGQHGLPRAGRADEERAVSTRRCDFQGALAAVLPTHVCQIERRVGVRLRRRGRGRKGKLPREHLRRLGQGADRVHLQVLDEGALRPVQLGHDDAAHAHPSREQRNGKHAAHGQHVAGEGQLSHDERRHGGGRDQARGLQQRQRDGKVEARPFLAHVTRREVHGHALVRKLPAGVPHGGGDADPRVDAGRIRQPDQEEPRQTARQVDLDGHRHGRRPEQRGAMERGMHASLPLRAACRARAEGSWPPRPVRKREGGLEMGRGRPATTSRATPTSSAGARA